METHLTRVARLADHAQTHAEIKDPSVVRLPDGTFAMFASIGRSQSQDWIVGRFAADHPCGPWQELEPVRFHGLSGPQLCAPAVTYEERDGRPLWTMYVQTACFEEDGVIALATSENGVDFHPQDPLLVTRHTLDRDQPRVVGVYDAGVARVEHLGRRLTCMFFTGCNRVGNGDIYLSVRDEARPGDGWTPGRLVLRQDEIPFHNRPSYEHYEWGLEGAGLVQLGRDLYLMVGVCFLERGQEHRGTRQRVFFAASNSPFGPYAPIGVPFEPWPYEEGAGEHGHPDAVVDGETMFLLYQERSGEGRPWHLRHAAFGLGELRAQANEALARRALALAALARAEAAAVPRPAPATEVEPALLAALAGRAGRDPTAGVLAAAWP
jgi:hypothetical protein